MRTISYVMFDDDERKLFSNANFGAPVAFPNPIFDIDKKNNHNADAKAQRLLRRLTTKGEIFSQEHLVEANALMMKVADACAEQSNVSYWIEHADYRPGVPGGNLIENPDMMIEVLTTARKQFATDAVAAVIVLRYAITQATPLREEVGA